MDDTPPTPYPDLNLILRDLVNSVQTVLRDNFVGAYLQGSFAVGDFDIHSDCDFIVVTERELSDEQVQALQGVHGRIYNLDSPWAHHLEGSYFPRDVLRHYDRAGGQLWFLDHGSFSLKRDKHCNTGIVRTVVREHGVTLAGPPPETLVDRVPVESLRREMMSVILGWGREIMADPEQYNNRFYQTYIVLSYSRMLHDLHTGNPGSKRAGTEWAKANLDPSWSALIDRTWEGRPNSEVSYHQPANPSDLHASVQYVQYVMDKATALYPEYAT